MLVSSVIALLAIGFTSVSAADYAPYNLLKDDRDAGRLVFLPTTLAQKEVILSNVEKTLNVWVNYDSKIANYGSAADPFPIVKNLRKNINTITDEELQLGLTDAFARARDQHTRWTNIAPYGCFHTTTGIKFAFMEGDADIAKKPTVVVVSTSTSPLIRPLFGEDFSKIKAGDELITIDGLSFVEWFEQNQFKSGDGANDFGGQRSGLGFLTTISGKINRLPSKDSVDFQFKSQANPQTSYTVKVPYVSGHDDDCWSLGSNLYKSLTGKTLPGTPPANPPVSAEQPGRSPESNTTQLSPRGYQMRSSENLEKRAAIKQSISSEQKFTVSMNPTDVTGVTWGIYQPESANMGVIGLENFSPEDVETKSLAVEKAIMIIRSLLVNELSNTNSVIYELRDNPGGNTRFAEGMVQLFKPGFKPFGDRYMINNITFNFFVNGKDPSVDPLAKAWQETKPGSRYSNVFFTSTVEAANTIGQAYVRPMGVFTDGRCYSSCEVFAGAIQGHSVGTIFGEDGQSGGGGAAVVELDPILIHGSPGDFQKFPFSQELASGPITYANTLSVGLIQTIRTGLYNGQLIEDLGIKTDIVFRPKWSDLQPNSTTNSQYARIAESLASIGQKNGQSKLHFVCEPFSFVKPIGGFSLDVETAGIEDFTVFQADGKTVAAQQKVTTDKQKLSLPVSTAGSVLGNSQIIIVGKNRGVQVLNTIRNVRYIPADDKYIKIGTPGFTFEGTSDSVGLYQSSTTAPGKGWNNLNGSWVIGNGVKYVGSVNSSLEAFFTAPVGTKINVGINVALDSEPEGDFLFLSVKSSGDVEDFLLSSKGVNDTTKTFNGVSGRNMAVNGTFPFTTKSQQFSVSIKFTSDEFMEFTGAAIRSLTFLVLANAVADNLSLRLSPPATRCNRRLLSGTTKRAILASNTARQAFIAAATNRNPDPVQCNTLRDEWSRLKAAATQLERVDGRKQWAKHADNLDRAVSDGRTDLVFAAARAMSGNSSRSAAVTPLYNSDGIVQYDPTSILRVMQGHYGSLAADTTGHSLDLQYWHDRQPIQVSPNTPTIRNSDILDQDFSWNQIAAALLQMSPRKAPGDDGITTAFYQAALYMPANTQEGVPPTPFVRVLLRVCGQVFASATIPRAWLCASIFSIDKKDGDPLNPGDKRGIALINVGLKLVCKVLQMRIERFVETNNLLSYEQAGFRKRKECVGQVVSLVDIIQRRQNAGLNTHVLFIDIRKAFDTVPVGALLWKLQNMGFPRRTLAFLKALYTSSSARARAGSLLSDPFPVQRGVRQGCPLSGLLFNLFINDILDGVAPITVPGLPRDTNPIRGPMYADDVAVFADSEQSLLAASTAIEQWANQWEMQFGVAKCGIISFTGHLAPRLDNPLDIRLHGQLVSRVESYKYLGVLIDSKLDHSAWLKQKRSALEHTISALHPVLANHQLTVNYRSRIFSAVVMGKAYYGFELVGGNKSHLAPLQTTINKGIRLFTGFPTLDCHWTPSDNDVFTLNIQGQLVRSQRWFWSRRTKQLYRNRYWLTPQVRPKTVKQRHSFALMETLRTCGDSASLQKYVTRQLLDTSGFFKDPSFDQSRAHGTRYLMLARMDALWTARKAIQIGILVDTHPFSADHCILCDQKLLSTSIAHLVVECEQVTGHRIQSRTSTSNSEITTQTAGSRTRSGYGEGIYLAPRWSLKWRSRSGPAVVGRDCGA
ncbi:hypothetical protein BASA50_005080 [Batrachochytrium salamandrivorans]|uniref:Reverse transcriptase domain-containing protein n=1 Tax=Batrachochytrium salamandrivorans TaxID=1357716 RepID=A0ABQ8FGM8_9FUNG|nr:hypothetical protein BASA50_005080 [Batrachochytrium salamandrivorans]